MRRRWHRPHPVAGSQIGGFVVAVIFALAVIALVGLMVSGRLRPSTPLIVFCVIFGFGVGIGWSWYCRGLYVSEHGLRMRGVDGRRTLRWSQIRAIHCSRSRVPDESDPAIWIVLKDGDRIEAPVKGSHVLPTLGMGETQWGTRITSRSSLVLPMNEFDDALAVLRECLAKSRSGPLRFE